YKKEDVVTIVKNYTASLQWNTNLPYILVTAFALLISCTHAILNDIKEWKACHFASSCLCKTVPGSENIIADCSGKDLLRIPKLPHNLQNLFIQNNNISRIEDGIFEDSSLLKTLDLSFNRISHLRKNSFKGLQNLISLNLSNNDLKYENKSFEISAFYFLENLKSLNLKGNVNTSFVPDLWKLRSLELLSIDYVATKIAILDEKFSNLKKLTAAGNRIQRIESGTVRYFPQSLTSADVGDNIFSFGEYVLELKDLPITSLEFSDNFTPHDVFDSYVEECPLIEETVTINSINNLYFYELPFFEKWKKKSGCFPVPGKLKKVLLRSNYLQYEIHNLCFMENELKYLSLSDNVLHTWTGPVTNIRKLTDLDLSANFCSNISKTFFSPDFINVRCLLLQNNLLGLVLPTDVDGEIFQNLYNVKYINLSKNKIANIPNLLFKEQHNLERLDLSENMIDDINFKISHMRKLMFMNVRNNRISTLSQYAMNELDSIAKENNNLTIDLSGNNLVCNCDSLSFVKWIVNTPTNFHLLEKYECKTSKKSISFFRNPREVYETIQKECMSYEGLIVGVTTGILMFIFILCGGIVYRYRWKLRYLYYMVKVKWHDPEHKSDNKDERLYMYDAFVSYANEDDTFVHHKLLNNLEKNGGIQLCLHKRNFLPGNDIATNITSAIHNSRKTIVIMSANYLASYWCMFEL
ncbi:toll-like receptor 13, partial [Mytilus galloprovincialis]